MRQDGYPEHHLPKLFQGIVCSEEQHFGFAGPLSIAGDQHKTLSQNGIDLVLIFELPMLGVKPQDPKPLSKLSQHAVDHEMLFHGIHHS
jgi:hypothetical protein